MPRIDTYCCMIQSGMSSVFSYLIHKQMILWMFTEIMVQMGGKDGTALEHWSISAGKENFQLSFK